MKKPDLSGLKRIRNANAALAGALMAACQEYANGGFRGRPIVAQHFTAGNAGRYGWDPLSQAYAARKAGQAPSLRKEMKARGAVVAKMDPKVPFRSRTGILTGEGSGANLPMLVRTGKTRDAITSGSATVKQVGRESFVITWPNQPPYAIFLHTGTPKMPKRSPVEPNDQDRTAIIAAANRHLSLALGKGGSVALGQFGDRARVH